MKRVTCWKDVEAFGIIALTGEACGLSYRILFDLTEQGRKIILKCLGLQAISSEPWNSQTGGKPHVASILMSQDMLIPVGVFALLDNGCQEVWLLQDKSVVGFDGHQYDPDHRKMLEPTRVRRFGYQGTAGDRNVHVMSGRVQ